MGVEGSQRFNRLDEAFEEPASAQAGGPSSSPEPDSPLDDLVARFSASREDLWRYASAGLDQVKRAVRDFLLWLVLAALGVLAALTVLVTAVVMVVDSLADLLVDMTGLPGWAGGLIVGGTLLASIAGGLALIVYGVRKGSLQRTIDKYERRRRSTSDEV